MKTKVPYPMLCLILAVILFSCQKESKNTENQEQVKIVFDTTKIVDYASFECFAHYSYSLGTEILQLGFCWSNTGDIPTIMDDTVRCKDQQLNFSAVLKLPTSDMIEIRPFVVTKQNVYYCDSRIVYTKNPPLPGYQFMFNLTGGPSEIKHWVLDIEKQYFHNPLDFYGDEDVGGHSDYTWGPWGGTNFVDWKDKMGEEGSISFDHSYNVTLTMGGIDKTGAYSIDIYERDPDFLYLTEGISLWDNMLDGAYSYLRELSNNMADISFSNNIRFPIDSTRIEEAIFLDQDLKNVTLMHVSDSALVLRVKQTFQTSAEGTEYSPRWLLYNYIVEEYDY